MRKVQRSPGVAKRAPHSSLLTPHSSLLTKITASLYIHVPFCAGFCDYCDFYSAALAEDDPRPQRYVERALLDAEMLFNEYGPGRVPTVYIGGGTPSVLGAGGMARLLKGIALLLPNKSGEFTVEANPESAGEAFLAACRENGVNRLSVGVQSFHEPSRQAVHRCGDGALLPAQLALIAEYFPRSFSADLMSGLPFQDEAVLLRDVETLLSFEPAHVSLYALTLEEGTALAGRVRRTAGRGGKRELPPAEEADRLWLAGRDALERSGYAQYEVSNFSLPGRRSRHNIRYWRMKNWLALGPGASGTLIDDQAGTGRRYTVTADVDAWLDRRDRDGPPPVTEEPLDRLTLMKESLLMGFRFSGGPDEALFRRRFGRGVGEAIPQTIAAWRGRGLFRGDRPALTREGLLFLDPFLIDAFRELEDG